MPKMSVGIKKTSLLASFDEICQYSAALSKGCESDFMKFVKNQESCRQKWLQAEQGHHPLHETITKLSSEKSALEVKLKHTRNQLDMEMKRRMKAENGREDMDQQLSLIRELLTDNNKINGLTKEEKESLAFLSYNASACHDHAPRSPSKRLSAIHEKSADILSASDLSFDRTDEDLDVSYLRGGRKWKRLNKKRPSAPPFEEESEESPKRARTDVYHLPTQDTSVVTTTVAFHSSGPITTTTQIDSVPKLTTFERPPPPGNRGKPSRTHLRSNHGAEDDTFWNDNPSLCDALHAGQQQAIHTEFDRSPIHRSRSTRKHTFVSKTVIKPESCYPCGKRIKFGKYAMRCKDCRLVCHPDCKDIAPLPCVPASSTPGKSQTLYLEELVPPNPPLVPAIVVQLINEIENRGLNERGMYRVPGSETVVKELKQRLLQNRENPHLDRVTDIHTLCGALKDFIRKLPEPLVTFKLHTKFVQAADMNDMEDSITATYQAISELPTANRDTLAYIILHLQRVSEAAECQMGVSNVAKVFGPTIVGNATENPTPQDIMRDTRLQPPVVERFLSLPSDFWKSFTNVPSGNLMVGSDMNVISNPNTVTPQSKQGYGSMLGPVHTPGKTPKKTPSSSSLGKSILNKASLTPRFGSKSSVSSNRRKPTHFFSSPTLK